MPKVGKRKTNGSAKVEQSKPTAPKKAKIETKQSGTIAATCTSKYFPTSKRDEDSKKTELIPTLNNVGKKALNGKRLDFSFYDKSCSDLAEALLGKTVVTMSNGKRLAGKIVETEAYLGPIDRAAHSYNGKRTPKTEAMFMAPGTAYVYNIYGMYCCVNISAQVDGAAVLIRALEPIENLKIMDKLRTKGKEGSSFMKKNGKGLCNGPSKLCQALGIKKDEINQLDLCKTDVIWLEEGEKIASDKVVKCKRINIDYAQDWKDKPLRFYVLGNEFVSVKDKLAEKEMTQGH